MKAATQNRMPGINLFKTAIPAGVAGIILPLHDKAKPEFVPTFGLLI